MASTYTRAITATLLKSGQVGTLGYRVIGSDGSTLIARTTSGISESGTTAQYSANVANWDRSWIGKILWEDADGVQLGQEDFIDSDPSPLVWATLLASLSISGSVGRSLSQLLGGLGSDSRPKISADAHTAGASVDLKPTGLDQIAIDDPGPVASQTTFAHRMNAVWRSIFGPYKLVKTGNGTGTRTYLADDGTTANATQAITETTSQQVVGKAT